MAKVTTRDRNKNKVDKNGKPKKPNWEYRFEMASVDGKRRQMSKSGFKTEKEAYNAGIAALNEYNSGYQVTRPSDMSYSDYLDIWLEKYVAVHLKPKTYEAYRGQINNHIKPMIGHYRLSALTPAILQDFVDKVKAKKISKNYRINIIGTMKKSLDYAVTPLQYVKYNYGKMVIVPRMVDDKSARVIFDSSEWEKISRRFPPGHKYRIPLVIGYHTGMRISEVLGLTWDRIDLENKTITVDRQLLRYKKNQDPVKWCFAPPKSNAGTRVIKIGDTLVNELKAELRNQKKNRLAYGEYSARYTTRELVDTFEEKLTEIIPAETDTIGLVCVSEDGRHMTNSRFMHAARTINQELGIKFNFHSLRHTHATMLAENGVNVKNLQARLGHELAQTTMQTYVHDTENMANQAVDTFEKLVRGQK